MKRPFFPKGLGVLNNQVVRRCSCELLWFVIWPSWKGVLLGLAFYLRRMLQWLRGLQKCREKTRNDTVTFKKIPKTVFFWGWFKLDFCIERNRDRKHDRVGRGNQWALKKDRTKLGKRKPKWHAFLLIAWIWFKMSKYRSTVCLWSLLLNLMPPKTNSNRKSATHDTRLIKFFVGGYICARLTTCVS